MDTIGIATFFAMGLGLGVLHAFDPDHVAAVSGMTAGERRHDKGGLWRFALHWSIGHGGILFIIACLVFLFGVAIPTKLSAFAEACVAFMLIAIGLVGFWKIHQQWSQGKSSQRNLNSATFVGMIHGTAGSAPLLALLPLTKIHEPIVGVVYVLLFSVGVCFAMLGLGGLISQGIKALQKFSWRFEVVIHAILALFSFLLGLKLLFV